MIKIVLNALINFLSKTEPFQIVFNIFIPLSLLKVMYYFIHKKLHILQILIHLQIF